MAHAIARQVGDIEVNILTDGDLTFDAGLFPGTDAARIDALLAQAGAEGIRTNFNAALIRTGGRVVLADAGPRDLFGPTCGRLPQGLAECGVAPAGIDTLFITHLHPDHIAGALTPEGEAVFENAELVLSRTEHAFWSAPIPGADETLSGWQQLAQALLSAYGDRLRLIEPEGGEVAPGLTTLALPGHTPGHVGWRASAQGAQLVHIGDLVHAPALQIPDPQIAIAFDIDMDMARATRLRLLDALAGEPGAAITGGHLLAPALNRVERAGTGFRLVPA